MSWLGSIDRPKNGETDIRVIFQKRRMGFPVVPLSPEIEIGIRGCTQFMMNVFLFNRCVDKLNGRNSVGRMTEIRVCEDGSVLVSFMD